MKTRDQLNRPSQINYTFRTKVTDLRTGEVLKGIHFQVLNPQAQAISQTSTDVEGNLYWTETITIAHNQTAQDILLDRTLLTEGIIKGRKNIKIIVNPLKDENASSGSSNTILDSRFHPDAFATNTWIAFDQYVTKSERNTIGQSASMRESEPHIILDARRGIRFHHRSQEEWKLTNALEAEIEKTYKLEFSLKYRSRLSRDGTDSGYETLPNGMYKITTSIVGSYSKASSFGNASPHSETNDIYISSDTQEVEVANGNVNFDTKIKIRELAILKNRSILILDITPLDDRVVNGLGLTGQRIVADTILKPASEFTEVISTHWLNQEKQLQRFPVIYHPYLNSPLHSLTDLANQQSEDFFNASNRNTGPEYYAAMNNLEIVQIPNHNSFEIETKRNIEITDEKLYQRLFKSIYGYYLMHTEDNQALCKYWINNLYQNAVEEFNSEETKERLFVECSAAFISQTNSYSPDMIPNLLSHGDFPGHVREPGNPEAMRWISNGIFRIRPVWTNMKVQDSRADFLLGQIEKLYISSIFTTQESVAETHGMSRTAVGGLSTSFVPVLNIGGSVSRYVSFQEESSYASENLSAVAIWLASEKAKVAYRIQQVQQCVTVRIDLNFVERTMNKLATPWFFGSQKDWALLDRGLMICEPVKEIKVPLEVSDWYHYVSQIFAPNLQLDPYKLANQSWLLRIRGKTQYEDFRAFLSGREGNPEHKVSLLGPNELAENAYERYKNLELPVYPGIYIPNRNDIRNFNRTDN